MHMPEFFSIAHGQSIVTCPNCGGDHYESNRFDETLFLEIERDALLLRFDGKYKKARALMVALAAVKIENTLRHEYFCLSCGVAFDA